MAERATDTINIDSSPTALLRLAAVGVVMTFLSAVGGFLLVPDMRPSSIVRAISIFGTAFFTLCTLTVLWRLLFDRGPVVTVSPQGICDRRVAADVIPWSAIRRISTQEHTGQRTLVLNVDPAFERTLRLSMIARYARGANRALGADGLCVTAQGLQIGYDDLFELVKQRAPEVARP